MPRRRPVVTPNVWRVAAFEQTITALEAARNLASSRRPLSLITAPAGSGKTFAAEWYAEHHSGVKLAVCPPRDILTAKSLLGAVGASVGIADDAFTKNYALFVAVCDALAAAGAFLIVDEADRLYASNADLLRELAEVSHTAVCYLGCPGVRATLARVPATHHRIGLSYSVPPVELRDLEQILFGKFEAVVVKEIYEQTSGNLRHLEALLDLLDRVQATGKRADITPKVVKLTAARYLLQEAA